MTKSPLRLCAASTVAGILFFTQAGFAQMKINFQVPRDGRVSLAVYNAQGQMVRTLLTGAPRKAGRYTQSWDGLDRYGRALPPGRYTWKTLSTTGLSAEFITQIGQNPDPIWEEGVSNHAPSYAGAIDATGVYRIGEFNEGAHAGVKTNLNGRYLWTTNRDKLDPWAHFGAALSVVNGTLYELIFDGTLYRYNAATGETYTKGNGDGLWNLRWEAGPNEPKLPDEKRRKYVRELGLDMSAAPLGPTSGVLAVSYRAHNAVRWFDAATGKLLRETSVPEPVAVNVQNGGDALVISRGAVLRLPFDGGATSTIIPASALQSPWRLCVSQKDGVLYVAANSELASGKDAPEAHFVQRFSPDGRLLSTLGRKDGRQDGTYVPSDFRGITDIEADTIGGFLVSEGHFQPPRRSAHFDLSGKLLREWLGAQEYGALATPEPNDPQWVWLHLNGEQGGFARFQVDYATGKWRIAETYWLSLRRNSLWRNGNHAYRIYERGGKLHFFSTSGQQALSALVYDPARKTMRVSNLSGKLEGGDFWNDLNDDGLPQPEEMEKFGQQVGGSVVGADFTLFTTPQPSAFHSGPLLKPVRATTGGTPVYGFDKTVTWPAWKEWDAEYRGWDIWPAPDGGWYSCFADNLRAAHDGWENHGAWYFNSTSGINRLVKWDKNWNQVWSVGRHSPDNDHETGSQAMPRGLVGMAHGHIVWADASDAEVARPTVWTSDGLYIDELLRVATDTTPRQMYGEKNTHEFALGHLAVEPKTGDILYYSVSVNGGSPIYRIRGWQNQWRETGTVEIAAKAPEARRDGSGVKAEYFNTPDCSGAAVLTRTEPVIYFNWGKKTPVAAITAERYSVRWSGSLEAMTNEATRFEIRGNFPWRDEGRPLWAKLWLGGNLLMDATSFPATARVLLRAGERLDFKLEAGFQSGAAAMSLNWDTPGLDRRTILPAFWHPEPGPQRALAPVVEKRPEKIAEFSFDEKSSAVAWSREGVEIFGRLTGNARRVAGRSGQGVLLEGRGAFDPALLVLDEELRLPDTNYSIGFWFKTTSPDLRLLRAQRYSGYNNVWNDHNIVMQGGRLRFTLQGDAPLQSQSTLSDGRWHHVVTTVDEGGQKLFVDGRLIGTGKLSRRTLHSNRLPLELGPGHDVYETGTASVTFDDLIVWGKTLSPEEVTRLSSAPALKP